MANRFLIRIDEANARHRHFTVFANGANCGHLIMTNTEFWSFARGLMAGHKPGSVDIELLPHSPASGSRPEDPRGDERTGDERTENGG